MEAGASRATGQLRNSSRRQESLPDPEGDLLAWDRFAHTIDGDEAAGSFEACAALANDGTAESLTELRCVLYVNHERARRPGLWTGSGAYWQGLG